MIGLVALALMIVVSVLYFNDLGLKTVLGFWGAYIVTWFLPLLGISGFVAVICGFFVAGAFYAMAKAA